MEASIYCRECLRVLALLALGLFAVGANAQGTEARRHSEAPRTQDFLSSAPEENVRSIETLGKGEPSVMDINLVDRDGACPFPDDAHCIFDESERDPWAGCLRVSFSLPVSSRQHISGSWCRERTTSISVTVMAALVRRRELRHVGEYGRRCNRDERPVWCLDGHLGFQRPTHGPGGRWWDVREAETAGRLCLHRSPRWPQCRSLLSLS